MSGIKSISEKRAEEAQNSSFSNSLELFLADGDQAYVAIVPTGDEDDTRLDDFWRHSVQASDKDGNKSWNNHLCGKTLDRYCEWCANKGDKPQHRFGFWCYVYYILHDKKKNDDWEEINQKGITSYKQVVNEFRMFSIPFGRSDFQWNQLVDIYTDCDGLNKQVVRIKRTGEQMQTTYALTAMPNAVKWTKEQKEASEELLSVIDFFKKQEEDKSKQQEETKPVRLNGEKSSELFDEETSEEDSSLSEVEELFDSNEDELF